MRLSLIGEIRKSIEQLNPREVVDAAQRPVRILLLADSEPIYAYLERFLAPDGPASPAASMLFREGQLEHADIVIAETGVPYPKGAFLFHPDHPERLVEAILASFDRADKDRQLALARCFPAFRPAVSERIRQTVSKENALFAVATALPNIAPVISWLPWAVPEALSDTAVLTVNQIRMAFLLAAANGKPIGYREQKAEIAGIVAGALGWRALARELIGKLPFGAGLIPKAAVAYAATWIEGRSLERLYAHGFGFSRKERSAIRDEAMSRGKQAASAFLEAYRKSRGESEYKAPAKPAAK